MMNLGKIKFNLLLLCSSALSAQKGEILKVGQNESY